MGILMGISSCVINGSGYESLSEKEKEKVKDCSTRIDSIKNDGNIYMVDAKQVKQYLSDKDCVLVYIWAPYCKSDICVSPLDAEKICKERGIELCLVSDSYEDTDLAGNVKCPILVISRLAYATNNLPKYRSLFEEELTGKTDKETGYSRYHLFVHGKYVKSFEKITDIPQK